MRNDRVQFIVNSQDLHTTTYRCVAVSSAGSLRSRDVHVRAGKKVSLTLRNVLEDVCIHSFYDYEY